MIELDEQPSEARRPDGFNPFNTWHKIGEVSLGETAAYFGDPNNARDNGDTGQHWSFSLGNVVGSQQGQTTAVPNFDELFHVDSGTGEIFLLDPLALDFELYSVYSLNVVVEDNGNSRTGNSLSAAVTVDIVLRDVNEKPTGENLEVSVAENRPIGTVIGDVTVTDPDDQVFIYSIDSLTALDKDGNPAFVLTDPEFDR